MSEILLINPRKKRAKKSATGRITPAKRKRVKKMAKKRTRKKATKRRRPRTNPSKGRKAATYTSGLLKGLNFKTAFGNIAPIQLGMFAAKFAAKRFGESATETDPDSWNWASYAKGGLGAVVAGMIAQNFKSGWGQKVLEGGLNIMAYKIIQNELITKSEFATEWLGADQPSYEEGVWEVGRDGGYFPVDERHRLPEMAGTGTLEPVGPLGDQLEPVGRLGQDPFDKAFLRS
jgi:hypothetical protein